MHYYKRHIGDYAKKAGHLSPLEHGVYNLIIDNYYDREHAPTETEAMRWARARTTDEQEAVRVVLSEFFTIDGERYIQNRIEEELTDYHAKAETNRLIAVAREASKRAKSGIRIDNEASTNRAPDVVESCSSGEPNHKPLTINHKPIPKTKKTPKPDGIDALFVGVDAQVVADFKEVRKIKRAAITPTAIKMIVDEAEKAGMTLEAALRVCCARGWSGFKAAWLERDGVAYDRRAGPSQKGTQDMGENARNFDDPFATGGK